MGTLKPLEGEPLTFWHVGGDIIWRGDGRCAAIERSQAETLRDIYVDECKAGWAARNRKASYLAAKLWTELTHAMDAQDTWARVVGGSALAEMLLEAHRRAA